MKEFTADDLPNMPRLGLTHGQCYFDTDTKFTYCWNAKAAVWLKIKSIPGPDARDKHIEYLEAVLRQIASYAGTETAAATAAKWASEALVKSAYWPSDHTDESALAAQQQQGQPEP